VAKATSSLEYMWPRATIELYMNKRMIIKIAGRVIAVGIAGLAATYGLVLTPEQQALLGVMLEGVLSL